MTGALSRRDGLLPAPATYLAHFEWRPPRWQRGRARADWRQWRRRATRSSFRRPALVRAGAAPINLCSASSRRARRGSLLRQIIGAAGMRRRRAAIWPCEPRRRRPPAVDVDAPLPSRAADRRVGGGARKSRRRRGARRGDLERRARQGDKGVRMGSWTSARTEKV